MISETRTKFTSWLKSPRNAVIAGVSALAIVSVGTMSAFALTGTPTDTKTAQNSVTTAESTENLQNTASDSQNAAPATTAPTETAPSTTNTTTHTNTAPATTPQAPAAPVAPTYSDSYPAEWKNGCDAIDTWGMTTCQSSSYAAVKVNEAFGNMPKWGYTGQGDVSHWVANANAANIPVGTTPKLHSVGISGNFSAFVEAVNNDGTIDVSYYNWQYNKAFGYKTSIPASTYSNYIYFGN